MKKLLTYSFISFILFIGLSTKVSAASNSNAVLFLSSDNDQTLVGNYTSYDLVLNTLGNKIDEIDVQFIIKGPFNHQAMTYNIHPEHQEKLHDSSPLYVYRYNSIKEGDDIVRVNVVLKSNGGKPFNEGSAAIPIYRVRFPTTSAGTLSGYIDSSHTYVSYTAESKNDYDNYTPETKPHLITVISYSSPTPIPTKNPTPRPTKIPSPTPSPVPTINPSPTPKSEYDKKFAQVEQEIKDLRTEVTNQGERLSLLERIIQSLKNFFRSIFK